MTAPALRTILAIDPGRSKCGVAVCQPGRVVARAVMPLDSLAAYVANCQARYDITDVLVGNRTGAAAVEHLLAAVGVSPVRLVDEAGTTLRARDRYFKDHPPRGWRRIIPRGLLTPSEPYDDYAAILLAEAVLGSEDQKESPTGCRRE